jgi:hypothetical protein
MLQSGSKRREKNACFRRNEKSEIFLCRYTENTYMHTGETDYVLSVYRKNFYARRK